MTKKIWMLSALVAASMTLTAACGNDDATVTDVVYDTPSTTTETTSETEVQKPMKESGTYTSMFDSDLAQFRLPASGDTVVTLVTNKGNIDLLLFPEAAPKAVENFTTHGENDYYDDVIFHRVINDFMIQGGDPEGTGTGGESIWGDNFEDEFNDSYFPVRGALAMANAGPGTNGSQFFIVQSGMSDAKSKEADNWASEMEKYGFDAQMIDAYKTLGGTPHLFNRHTVFGQVVAGMDVVDAIAAVEVGSGDRPVEDVIIKDVLIKVIE